MADKKIEMSSIDKWYNCFNTVIQNDFKKVIFFITSKTYSMWEKVYVWCLSGEKLFPHWHNNRKIRNKPIDELEKKKAEFKEKSCFSLHKNQETLRKYEIKQRQVLFSQIWEDIRYFFKYIWESIPGKKELTNLCSHSVLLKLSAIIFLQLRKIYITIQLSFLGQSFPGLSGFFENFLYDPLMGLRVVYYLLILALHVYAFYSARYGLGTKLLFSDLNWSNPSNRIEKKQADRIYDFYHKPIFNRSIEEYYELGDTPKRNEAPEWGYWARNIIGNLTLHKSVVDERDREYREIAGFDDKNPDFPNITHWYRTFVYLRIGQTDPIPDLDELGVDHDHGEVIWMILHWTFGMNPLIGLAKRTFCMTPEQSFDLSQVSSLTNESVTNKVFFEKGDSKLFDEKILWSNTMSSWHFQNRSIKYFDTSDDLNGRVCSTRGSFDLNGIHKEYMRYIPWLNWFVVRYDDLFGILREVAGEFDTISMEPPNRTMWNSIVAYAFYNKNLKGWEKAPYERKHLFPVFSPEKLKQGKIIFCKIPPELANQTTRPDFINSTSCKDLIWVSIQWLNEKEKFRRNVFLKNYLYSATFLVRIKPMLRDIITLRFSTVEERYDVYKSFENKHNKERTARGAEEYNERKEGNREFKAKNKDRKLCPTFGSPGQCEEIFNMIRYNILSSIIGAVSTFYSMVNWNSFKDAELRNTWIPNLELYWSLGCAFFYQVFLVQTARQYRSEVNEFLYSSFWAWLPEYAGEASVRLALMISATISTRNFFYSSVVGYSLWHLYTTYLEYMWKDILETKGVKKRPFMRSYCDETNRYPDYPVFKNCGDYYYEPWFLRDLWEGMFYTLQVALAAHFHTIEGRDSIVWYLGLVHWIFIKQADFWPYMYYEIILPLIPVTNKLFGFIFKILFYDIMASSSFIVMKVLFKEYLILTKD